MVAGARECGGAAGIVRAEAWLGRGWVRRVGVGSAQRVQWQ